MLFYYHYNLIHFYRLKKALPRHRNIPAMSMNYTMLQSHYSPDCMDKRNRYMVDHADFIIAVWDGRPSGTGKTVTYARGRNGKFIIVIDPVTLAIERL